MQRVLSHLLLLAALLCCIAHTAAYVKVMSFDTSQYESVDILDVVTNAKEDDTFTNLQNTAQWIAHALADKQPDVVFLFNAARLSTIYEGIEQEVELVEHDTVEEVQSAAAADGVAYSAVHTLELNEARGEGRSSLFYTDDSVARVVFSNVVLVKSSEVDKVDLSAAASGLFAATSDYPIEVTDYVGRVTTELVDVFSGYQRIPFTKEGKRWMVTGTRLDPDSAVNSAQAQELLAITAGDHNAVLLGALNFEPTSSLYAHVLEQDFEDLGLFRALDANPTCCSDSSNNRRLDFVFARNGNERIIDHEYTVLEAGAAHAGVFASLSSPRRGPEPVKAKPVSPPEPVLIQTFSVPSSSIIGEDDDESDSDPLVTPTTPGDDGDGTFFATGPLSPTTPEDDEDRRISPTTPLRTSSGGLVTDGITFSAAVALRAPAVVAAACAVVLAVVAM